MTGCMDRRLAVKYRIIDSAEFYDVPMQEGHAVANYLLGIEIAEDLNYDFQGGARITETSLVVRAHTLKRFYV